MVGRSLSRHLLLDGEKEGGVPEVSGVHLQRT